LRSAFGNCGWPDAAVAAPAIGCSAKEKSCATVAQRRRDGPSPADGSATGGIDDVGTEGFIVRMRIGRIATPTAAGGTRAARGTAPASFLVRDAAFLPSPSIGHVLTEDDVAPPTLNLCLLSPGCQARCMPTTATRRVRDGPVGSEISGTSMLNCTDGDGPDGKRDATERAGGPGVEASAR
jgi:hypothetical protein